MRNFLGRANGHVFLHCKRQKTRQSTERIDVKAATFHIGYSGIGYSNSFGPKNNLLDCLGICRGDNIEMFLRDKDGTGTLRNVSKVLILILKLI